jgi:hypothetical protein
LSKTFKDNVKLRFNCPDLLNRLNLANKL